MARCRLVEGRAHHLALDRARHVGDLFRPLVDQQHDQVHLGMVGDDAVRDVLHQHRLAGARLGDDQRALALAERGHDVDHPTADVLIARILDLEGQLLGRVVGRQVVEMDPVPRALRRIEVDRVDLEQGEVALALLGRADLAIDEVAGAQAEAPDLARRHVDVIRPGQIVDVRRAQEAEAVLQDLQHALAVDRNAALGQALERREHEIGLAQRAGVLDPEFLGVFQQFCRRAPLQLGQVHEAGDVGFVFFGYGSGFLLEHLDLARLGELLRKHTLRAAAGPPPAVVGFGADEVAHAGRIWTVAVPSQFNHLCQTLNRGRSGVLLVVRASEPAR